MKDYLLYTVEDFVCDESYLRYYFRKNEDDIRFWTEWIGLHPEKLDVIISANTYIDAFSIRLPEPEFQKEQQRFAEALKNLSSGDEFSAPGIDEEPERRIIPFRKKMFWAAAFIIIISIAFLYSVNKGNSNLSPAQNIAEQTGTINKYVPKGEQARIILPDGSEVQLNADSRLIYPSKFTGATREVQLIGEAFFYVKHDAQHPFHVLSSNLVTTVLGTTFNVKCYPDEKNVKVALVTGKVRLDRIADPENKKVMGETLLLAPSEMGVFNRGSLSLEKTNYNINEETGWRDGIIIFRDADFNEIAERLERTYNVKLINASKKTEFRFRGTFSNTSAQEIVKTICLSKKLTYTTRGNVITIH